MPIQKHYTKAAKLVDAATLHSRVQKAMLTVTKSCVIAMRQGWLTGPHASSLDDQLWRLDVALIAALPLPAKRTSGAELVLFED